MDNSTEPIKPAEGKIATIKKESRRTVSTAPAKAISDAAKAEIAPVLTQLDAITQALQEMPNQFQTAAGGSALALKESLNPMIQSVTALRTSLDHLPVLLSQQMDGALLQIQMETQALRNGLSTLPQALAQQIAPLLAIGERLDEVLGSQRAGLHALHSESLAIVESTLETATGKVTSLTTALVNQGRQTAGVLREIRTVPNEMRQVIGTTQRETRRAAARIVQASNATVQAVNDARRSHWHPAVQSLATGVVVVALLLGSQWLGIVDLRWLQPQGAAVKAQAWDRLYQESSPQTREWMDRQTGN